MNTLIIQWLLKHKATCNLLLWDNAQKIIWQESEIDADKIGEVIKNKALGKNNRIIVLLPGQWVTVSEVELPKRISSKQREKMIGFAIEDELIDDPSTMHLVLAEPSTTLIKGKKPTKTSKTQLYPVAIISHSKMTEIIAELEKQKIYPDSIIPDYLAINAPKQKPAADKSIRNFSVSIIKDEALIRTSNTQGYSIDSKQLPWFCQQLYQQQSASDEALITHIQLNSDAADLPWMWPEDLTTTMPLEVTTQCKAEECWSFSEMIKPPLNLLSGKYRSKGKYSHLGDNEKTRIWRKFAYTVILFVIVAVASKGARYNILSTENKTYMQKVNAEVKKYYPEADTSSLANTKKQVQLLLLGIKKQDQHNNILKQLITLDDLLSSNKQTKILALNYKTNAWEMILQASSPSVLKNITAKLNKNKWKTTYRPASDKIKKSFDTLLQDEPDKNDAISILEISSKQTNKSK